MVTKGEYNPADMVLGYSSIAALFPIMTQALYYTPNQAITNVVGLTYALTRYYFGNLNDVKPAAVIAGIPLGTIEEESHGISDRETRYRANGGIFLAHKEGGNESLRIVGKAWGDNRFLFLNMLDFLFLWGSANVVDYYKQTNRTGFWAEANVLTPADTQPLINPTILERTTDPWVEIEQNTISSGIEESRLTFPIITKNRIYLSMYIETYTWSQSIDKNGRKCITYTMFFRKYEPEPEYEFANIIIPAKEEGEKDYYRHVYRQKTTADKKLSWAMGKASLEILPTLAIQGGGIFSFSKFSNFAMQMARNYFGTGTEEEGKIPGIIEERFF